MDHMRSQLCAAWCAAQQEQHDEALVQRLASDATIHSAATSLGGSFGGGDLVDWPGLCGIDEVLPRVPSLTYSSCTGASSLSGASQDNTVAPSCAAARLLQADSIDTDVYTDARRQQQQPRRQHHHDHHHDQAGGRRCSSPGVLHHPQACPMKRCGTEAVQRGRRSSLQGSHMQQQLLLPELLGLSTPQAQQQQQQQQQAQGSPTPTCSSQLVSHALADQRRCSHPPPPQQPGMDATSKQQQLTVMLQALQGSQVGTGARQLAGSLLLRLQSQPQQQEQQQQQQLCVACGGWGCHCQSTSCNATELGGLTASTAAAAPASDPGSKRSQLAAAMEVKQLLEQVAAAVSPAFAEQLRRRVVGEVKAVADAQLRTGQHFDLAAQLQHVLPKLRPAVAAACQLQQTVAAISGHGAAAAALQPAVLAALPAAGEARAGGGGCGTQCDDNGSGGYLLTAAMMEAALTAAAAEASAPRQQYHHQQQQQQQQQLAARAASCMPLQHTGQQGLAQASGAASTCNAWFSAPDQLVGGMGGADLECLLQQELEAARRSAHPLQQTYLGLQQ